MASKPQASPSIPRKSKDITSNIKSKHLNPKYPTSLPANLPSYHIPVNQERHRQQDNPSSGDRLCRYEEKRKWKEKKELNK